MNKLIFLFLLLGKIAFAAEPILATPIYHIPNLFKLRCYVHNVSVADNATVELSSYDGNGVLLSQQQSQLAPNQGAYLPAIDNNTANVGNDGDGVYCKFKLLNGTRASFVRAAGQVYHPAGTTYKILAAKGK